MLGFTPVSGSSLDNLAYPIVRVSQAGLLVVNQGSPKVRVSQVGLLVITPYTSPRIVAAFPNLPQSILAQ